MDDEDEIDSSWEEMYPDWIDDGAVNLVPFCLGSNTYSDGTF